MSNGPQGSTVASLARARVEPELVVGLATTTAGPKRPALHEEASHRRPEAQEQSQPIEAGPHCEALHNRESPQPTARTLTSGGQKSRTMRRRRLLLQHSRSLPLVNIPR